ncbi:MAG: hypothetical protein ABI610_05945, partial [Acidobacteriota bacterium]
HVARLEDLRASREAEAADAAARVAELQRHASGLENDRKRLAAHVARLEDIRTDRDRHVARLEDLRASREAEAADAAARVAELQRHAAGLEKDRETLAGHISHLEGVRTDKDRHITALNAERVERAEIEGRRVELQARVDDLTAHSRDLEDRFAAMRSRANREEGLRRGAEDRARQAERDLQELRQSTFWRMTAPARRILDLLKRALRE